MASKTDEITRKSPTESPTEALEGYDSLDLMEGLDVEELLSDDGLAASVEADIYNDVSEPHVLFDTVVLTEALKPLDVVVKDHQEVVAKTVHLIPVDGGVYLRANTGEHNLQIFVETLNNANALKKEFIIEYVTLKTVVRNSGSRLLIKEKNGSPVVSIYGGEVEFEDYNLDKTLYEHSSFDLDPADMEKLEAPLFVAFLERALKSMALATRPEDRKLRLEDGRAFASFLSSIVSFEGVPLQGISFRADYINVLMKMLSRNVEFFFKETEKHLIFRSGRSVVALPKIDTDDIKSVSDDIDSFAPVVSFSVSPSQFYHVLSTMKSLIGTTGVVRLETLNSQLRVKSATRTGKALDFPLAPAPAEADLKMSTPVASLITTALMMKKDPVIQIEVSKEDRISFRLDQMRIIFGSIIQ